MSDMPLLASILPIDVCADLSLKLFLNEHAPNEVYNIVHPHPQLEQELVKIAAEDYGKTLQVLESSQFEERLSEQKETNGLKDLHINQKQVGSYCAHAAPFGKMYFENSESFFENEKINKWIKNYGENFLPSMEYVRKGLKYLKETGVLERVIK